MRKNLKKAVELLEVVKLELEKGLTEQFEDKKLELSETISGLQEKISELREYRKL